MRFQRSPISLRMTRPFGGMARQKQSPFKTMSLARSLWRALLLSYSKIDSMVKHLGVQTKDALALAKVYSYKE